MALASELIEYYQNLLIIQYRNLDKARATIGTVVGPIIMPQASQQIFRFSAVPLAGSFVIQFNGINQTINWNDTALDVQNNIRAISGLAEAIVIGDTTVGFAFELVGVLNPNELFTVFSNSMSVIIVITNIEAKTLPQSVQEAFNVTDVVVGVDPYTVPMDNTTHVPAFPIKYALATAGVQVQTTLSIQTNLYNQGDQVYVLNPFVGKHVLCNGEGGGFVTSLGAGSWYLTIDDPSDVNGFSSATTTDEPPQETTPAAVGVQLDILGKYAGVTRNGVGFYGNAITLSDNDFRTLILMATLLNSAGSSLADIQNIIFPHFGAAMQVFDYQNMQMSYVISSGMVSFDLVQLFVTEGLLPKPMAVALSVIYVADVILFAFRTYEHTTLMHPFNDYTTYHTDWPWVSYANAIVV